MTDRSPVSGAMTPILAILLPVAAGARVGARAAAGQRQGRDDHAGDAGGDETMSGHYSSLKGALGCPRATHDGWNVGHRRPLGESKTCRGTTS